ncbi:NFX1-type zinc finger-containing protein 1-like [Mercenaria mercenaria]|uniref:NFX1-type zinc finger-containing protein 1-like n=1 Tax=Mercenaria mercenaria TaxID=6596 RepID=UPI00234F6819|nr:NFX1-type zinc finger-containing protein 1-like [Mercenaria mercenaria]
MESEKDRSNTRPPEKFKDKKRGSQTRGDRNDSKERKPDTTETPRHFKSERTTQPVGFARKQGQRSSHGARPKSVTYQNRPADNSISSQNQKNDIFRRRPRTAFGANENNFKTNSDIRNEDQGNNWRNGKFPRRQNTFQNIADDNFGRSHRSPVSDTHLSFGNPISDEINGCRPKVRPNTGMQSQYSRDRYSGWNNEKEVQKGRQMVIGFPFLKNLIGKDPGYIILELTKNKSALKDCLKRASENQEFLEVFLQALSEAYLSRTTPGLMIELFDSLKEGNFFDSVVFLLIDVMGNGKEIDSPVKQMLKNILVIINGQITRNPSSLFVVSRACTLLGQIIDGLSKEDRVVDEIVPMYQDLVEHKNKLEKEQKTYSGRKERQKPPDDFRQYSVCPSPSEITGTARPFLRRNKVEGEYDDLDHYLDVQFRLLREDFVGPLREGITEYIKIKTSKKPNQDEKSIRKLNIKIYENVSVHTPVVTEHGLCYKMKLEMSNFIKRVNWSVSKRLMYGSLVCLTDNDFNSFYLATVVGRDEEDIRNGFFIVHFEQEDVKTYEVLHKIFRMAETSAYFESYRHVLSSMQTFRQGDLPFEKYIIYCDRNVEAPAYLKPGSTYDLRPLVDQDIELQSERRLQTIGTRIPAVANNRFSSTSTEAKCVNILNKKGWPSKELLHLDESQYDAVQTALTSEFSIIQGPPGTGKTYIGLQIVKALLHNKSVWLGSDHRIRPMLVVCYTNHALDQFLEGIAKYFKGDILRVGGRSDSMVLKNCNLKHYRKCLGKLQMSRKQAREELDQHSDELRELAKTIEIYQTEIVGERFLREEMGPRLYNSLVQDFRGNIDRRKRYSYIIKWLGIKRIEEISRQQAEQAYETKTEEFVNVEDNTKQRQRHMVTETDEEDATNAPEKEQELLQKIRRRAGIVFSVEHGIQSKKDKNKKKENLIQQIFNRILKTTLERKISDNDIMGQDEADYIQDVWRLDHNTKWRMYRMWIQNLCIKEYNKIEARRTRFELASERYREAMMQEDKEIMKQASVIGMTTSCAARYQAVLRDIGPRIIIVEEAAEVLEAHIVTTLSKGCEHLILIGDHKQLRPNPTVYRLAIKYRLDVSLFERMIKNKMEFNCLKLQHRMRPEISCLVKHIYPDLLDDGSVKSYPNVKGVSTNIFLVNHESEEKIDEDIKSYSNPLEAQYAAQLCQYLLLQGYQRHEITILTTYTGQLMCIRKFMPKAQFEGVKVTVVDNFQGEENKIIILSLVRSNKIEKIGFLKTENRICVALSRAKYGFYVLGNFNQLAAYSTLWKRITDEMKENGCFGNGLKLCCQNHPQDNAIVAVEPGDFKKAPEGGCQKYCDIRLKCGHVCKRYCHVLDRAHETNTCVEPCTKILCDNGHKCPHRCFVKCGPCQVPMDKTIPICEHQQIVPCSVNPLKFSCRAPCEHILDCGHQCDKACGDAHTSHCKATIDFTFPCGHNSVILCGDTEVAKCQHPCEAILKCEHICSGTCSTCFSGKVHLPCRHECKRILVCGHACNDYCNSCPPCTEYCENRCVHSKCNKSCGEPCVPCQEQCSWKCWHYKCNRLCSQPCDRPRCNKACKKRLKCKHSCIGFCGEPCPNLCRICNKEKVTEIVFGYEDNSNARFVLLEDCMHVIESRALDKYMQMKDESNSIQLKGCPLCKTTIRKCLRYGKIVNQALEDVERVKQQMIGNNGIIDRVSRRIKENPIFSGTFYTNRIRIMRMARSRISTLDRYNICEYQDYFESSLTAFKKARLFTETQLLSLENRHRIAKAVIELRCNIKENYAKVNGKMFNGEKEMVILTSEFVERLTKNLGVLSEQEIEDFTREIQRGNVYVQFLKMKRAIKSAGKDKEATDDFQKVESLILDVQRFTEERETEIDSVINHLKDLLKIEGLGITEEERLEIVKAVGLSKGHWFKCAKSKYSVNALIFHVCTRSCWLDALVKLHDKIICFKCINTLKHLTS